jgi:5-methylcytosine-specific restriction protein A
MPDNRPNFRERGYTWEWDKARKKYLQIHPKCACGCGRKATVVDHIKPHRGNKDLFWDENNWQAMAKICHDRKTTTRDGGFGNELIA